MDSYFSLGFDQGIINRKAQKKDVVWTGTSILIVDDEREIADLVEVYLKNEEYDVYKCYTAKEAMDCIRTCKIDLAILDVMLPDEDGFSICRKIRLEHTFPVIMLTAKVEDLDKITGLTIGADDYITKPFNPLELIARVKAQLRRSMRYNEGTKPDEDVIDFSGLVLNRKSHECILNERPVSLTPTEFSILWLLCKNRGQVVSAEKLFLEVWGEKYYESSNNTVMVHIRHLREKMNEPASKPKFIKTVWGVGYTIEK